VPLVVEEIAVPLLARRFMSDTPVLDSLETEMSGALSYAQWRDLAGRHDRLSGAEQWRRDAQSRMYDHENIRVRLNQLRRLRRKGDDHGLLFVLNEGIHGNMEGMGKAQLYKRARCGTKQLIEDYINQISESLQYLAPRDFPGIPWAERIEFFQRASHCYGRSALMLSGGGTLGYFHLGVLKALIEQGLCPAVISGASAGAFVAAIVGTRTDAEFLALFEDNFIARELTANRGNIKIGFGRKNSIDMALIKREMQRLLPDMTFLEAYRKTGRSINITISPASPRQTSRLLNHIASPNVTVLSAVMASSALPGVFAPVQLEARNAAGEIKPYLPSRRWIDGSFSQDLPAKRLGRMYGVNHFIVSQVMPGLGREPDPRPGLRQISSDAMVAATKELVRGGLDWIQRRARVGPRLGTAMNALNALIDQQFVGDINIFPGYGMSNLSLILRMLSEEEMIHLLRAGERATWPKIPVIGMTTQIGRTLDGILHDFEVNEAHWLQRSSRAHGAPKNRA
jgi:TAG lipase / steryl ester hydrolase / phospholipase A2 / LPA acyltransferase